MARLSEAERERLRTLTVEYLLDVRAAYLAAGASPLKHWEQLQNRMLSAARRSTSADEWATALCRGLQLPALGPRGAASLVALSGAVREAGAARQWLDVVQAEYGLLMAMARLAADAARERREGAAG